MSGIKLPYPHLGQQRIRSEARRFNWLSAGRRWRKTTMGMSIATEAAVSGKRILWGAPTFDQVRVAWDEMRHGVGGYGKFIQQRMTAEFPGDGRVIFRSLDDPDNARGHTADGVVIDEVGDVKAAAWYEVLRPMLMDTDGWLWAIGTPRGHNFFWREHQNAMDSEDSRAWQVPTLGVAIEDGQLIRKPHLLENPNIPFSEIEQIWRTVPQRTFEQEILAQFIEDSGGVFRGVALLATATPQEKALDGHTYVFGVDWGKSNDFTVITVIDATTSELVYLDRFNRIDYTLQSERLKALAQRFKPLTVIAERNAMGEPIIERLQRDGMQIRPFLTTNTSKAAAIEALSLAFERGDIRILPNQVLVNELQAYEMERLPSGMLRYSAPEGMHDDTVMALAMGWQGVARRGVFFG